VVIKNVFFTKTAFQWQFNFQLFNPDQPCLPSEHTEVPTPSHTCTICPQVSLSGTVSAPLQPSQLERSDKGGKKFFSSSPELRAELNKEKQL